ncbi:outer membrane beta-barrel protein [Proteus mirabilis]
MFQAGIDYSLRKNVGINLGYLHSDTESNKHNIRLNSIQLSLGYRF